MINIKDFDPKLLDIEKKSYKYTDIYYIKYITMKSLDHVNIDCKNFVFIIFNNVYGYI